MKSLVLLLDYKSTFRYFQNTLSYKACAPAKAIGGTWSVELELAQFLCINPKEQKINPLKLQTSRCRADFII